MFRTEIGNGRYDRGDIIRAEGMSGNSPERIKEKTKTPRECLISNVLWMEVEGGDGDTLASNTKDPLKDKKLQDA